MYSLRQLRREVDALQRRLKPVLAVLRLRILAMEFCDEFDEAASRNAPCQGDILLDLSRMFMPRVGRAGFRLDTFKDLISYFMRCIDSRTHPNPMKSCSPCYPGLGEAPASAPTCGSGSAPPEKYPPRKGEGHSRGEPDSAEG